MTWKKTRSVLLLLWETLVDAIRFCLPVAGAFMAVLGTLADSHILDGRIWIVKVLFIAWVAVMLFTWGLGIHRFMHRLITKSMGLGGGKDSFHLIQGGYPENMLYYMQLAKEGKKVDKDAIGATWFAMGIDASAELSLSTSTGILKGVITLLGTDFQVSEERFQRCVNDVRRRLYPGEGELPFDAVLPVTIPVRSKAYYTGELNLLLVVNSRKTDQGRQLGKKDLVEVQDPRLTVKALFESCQNYRCRTIFLGAIGTNAGGAPYGVVLSEIINAYVNNLKKYSGPMAYPNDVVLSVRKSDMDTHGVNPRSIILFVRRLLRAHRSLQKS